MALVVEATLTFRSLNSGATSLPLYHFTKSTRVLTNIGPCAPSLYLEQTEPVIECVNSCNATAGVHAHVGKLI